MEQNNFYTLRGYDRQENHEISATMEDYLEMICRQAGEGGYVRINQLATLLNVTPPSSSKMVAKLREQGLVSFEPYGIISLTAKGREFGAYLLYRHDLLNRFFCRVNRSESELELVERIEHFIDRDTITNLEKLLSEIG